MGKQQPTTNPPTPPKLTEDLYPELSTFSVSPRVAEVMRKNGMNVTGEIQRLENAHKTGDFATKARQLNKLAYLSDQIEGGNAASGYLSAYRLRTPAEAAPRYNSVSTAQAFFGSIKNGFVDLGEAVPQLAVAGAGLTGIIDKSTWSKAQKSIEDTFAGLKTYVSQDYQKPLASYSDENGLDIDLNFKSLVGTTGTLMSYLLPGLLTAGAGSIASAGARKAAASAATTLARGEAVTSLATAGSVATKATGLSAFLQTFPLYQREALANGLDVQDATLFALPVAGLNAVIETANMGNLTRALGIGSKAAQSAIRQVSVQEAARALQGLAGKELTADMLLEAGRSTVKSTLGLIEKPQALGAMGRLAQVTRRVGRGFVEQGLPEGGEEFLQSLVENASKQIYNNLAGADATGRFQDPSFGQYAFDALYGTMLGAVVGSGLGTVVQGKQLDPTIYGYVAANVRDGLRKSLSLDDMLTGDATNRGRLKIFGILDHQLETGQIDEKTHADLVGKVGRMAELAQTFAGVDTFSTADQSTMFAISEARQQLSGKDAQLATFRQQYEQAAKLATDRSLPEGERLKAQFLQGQAEEQLGQAIDSPDGTLFSAEALQQQRRQAVESVVAQAMKMYSQDAARPTINAFVSDNVAQLQRQFGSVSYEDSFRPTKLMTDAATGGRLVANESQSILRRLERSGGKVSRPMQLDETGGFVPSERTEITDSYAAPVDNLSEFMTVFTALGDKANPLRAERYRAPDNSPQANLVRDGEEILTLLGQQQTADEQAGEGKKRKSRKDTEGMASLRTLARSYLNTADALLADEDYAPQYAPIADQLRQYAPEPLTEENAQPVGEDVDLMSLEDLPADVLTADAQPTDVTPTDANLQSQSTTDEPTTPQPRPALAAVNLSTVTARPPAGSDDFADGLQQSPVEEQRARAGIELSEALDDLARLADANGSDNAAGESLLQSLERANRALAAELDTYGAEPEPQPVDAGAAGTEPEPGGLEPQGGTQQKVKRNEPFSQSFVPVDMRSAILSYFARRGKINQSDFDRVAGEAMRRGEKGGNPYLNYLDGANRQTPLDNIARAIADSLYLTDYDEQAIMQQIIDTVLGFSKGNGPSAQLKEAYGNEPTQTLDAQLRDATDEAVSGLTPDEQTRVLETPDLVQAVTETALSQLDTYTDEEVDLIIDALTQQGYIGEDGSFGASAFIEDLPAIESGLLSFDPAGLELYRRFRESTIFNPQSTTPITDAASRRVPNESQPKEVADGLANDAVQVGPDRADERAGEPTNPTDDAGRSPADESAGERVVAPFDIELANLQKQKQAKERERSRLLKSLSERTATGDLFAGQNSTPVIENETSVSDEVYRAFRADPQGYVLPEALKVSIGRRLAENRADSRDMVIFQNRQQEITPYRQRGPKKQSELFAGETTGADAEASAKKAIAGLDAEIVAIERKVTDAQNRRATAIEQALDANERQGSLSFELTLPTEQPTEPSPRFQLVQALADELSAKLRTPAVTDPAEIDKALAEIGVSESLRLRGIKGFYYNDRVYLDPRRADASTVIEEFAHVWNGIVRQTNPKLWQQGVKLAKNSRYYKQLLADPDYRNLSTAAKEDEAVAKAITDRGASFIFDSSKQAWREWLREFWNYIKQKLGIATDKPIESLTLDEFVKLAAGQIKTGNLGGATSVGNPAFQLVPYTAFDFNGQRYSFQAKTDADGLRQELYLRDGQPIDRQTYEADLRRANILEAGSIPYRIHTATEATKQLVRDTVKELTERLPDKRYEETQFEKIYADLVGDTARLFGREYDDFTKQLVWQTVQAIYDRLPDGPRADVLQWERNSVQYQLSELNADATPDAILNAPVRSLDEWRQDATTYYQNPPSFNAKSAGALGKQTYTGVSPDLWSRAAGQFTAADRAFIKAVTEQTGWQLTGGSELSYAKDVTDGVKGYHVNGYHTADGRMVRLGSYQIGGLLTPFAQLYQSSTNRGRVFKTMFDNLGRWATLETFTGWIDDQAGTLKKLLTDVRRADQRRADYLDNHLQPLLSQLRQQMVPFSADSVGNADVPTVALSVYEVAGGGVAQRDIQLPVSAAMALVRQVETQVSSGYTTLTGVWAKPPTPQQLVRLNPDGSQTPLPRGFVYDDEQADTTRYINIDKAQYEALRARFTEGTGYDGEARAYASLVAYYNQPVVKRVLTEQTRLLRPAEPFADVADYYPLTPYQPGDAPQQSRAASRTLDENRRLLARSGPAPALLLTDPLRTAQGYLSALQDVVGSARLVDNLNTLQTQLTNDYEGPQKQKILSYLSGISRDLKDHRARLAQRRAEGGAGVVADKLLHNYTKSTFAFNLGLGLKQTATYAAAYGQQIIKDEFLRSGRALGTLARLTAGAYRDMEAPSVVNAQTGEGFRGKLTGSPTQDAGLLRELMGLDIADDAEREAYQQQAATLIARVTYQQTLYTGDVEWQQTDVAGAVGRGRQALNKLSAWVDTYGLAGLRRSDAAVILSYMVAAQEQSKAEGYAEGSAAYRSRVSELTESVVYATNMMGQLSDQTPLQRTTDWLAKMLSLYSGQQQKTLNSVLSRLSEWAKTGDEGALNRLASAFGWGVVANALWVGMVSVGARALMALLSGDEPDEDWTEAISWEVARNVAGTVPSLASNAVDYLISQNDTVRGNEDFADVPALETIAQGLDALDATKDYLLAEDAAKREKALDSAIYNVTSWAAKTTATPSSVVRLVREWGTHDADDGEP